MSIITDILDRAIETKARLLAAYGGRMPQTNDPIHRVFLEEAIRVAQQGSTDGEGNYAPPTDQDKRNMQGSRLLLDVLNRYGAENTAQLPSAIRAALRNGGLHRFDSSSFFGQLGDFITSPAFLIAVGGGAAVMASGAGAAGATSSLAEESASLGIADVGGAAALPSGLTAEQFAAGLSPGEISGTVTTAAEESAALGAGEVLDSTRTVLSSLPIEDAVTVQSVMQDMGIETLAKDAGGAVVKQLTTMGQSALASELMGMLGGGAGGAESGLSDELAAGAPRGSLPSGTKSATLGMPALVGAGLGLAGLVFFTRGEDKSPRRKRKVRRK